MNGKNLQTGGKAAPPAMSKEDEAGLRAILRRKEEEVKQLLAPEKGMRDIDALAKKIVTEVKALESKGGEDGAENSEFTYLAAVETPQQFHCPTCGNREQTNFVLDQKQGDTICLGSDGGGCGTVVQDHKVHEGSMYRKFEGEADRSHHGPAPNRLYSTAHNMRTWISDGSDAARLRNLAEEVEMGLSNVGKEERKTRTAYKDQMKREAFDLVNHIAANCDLHETVVVRAKELFAGWRNVKEHVNQKHAVICACIVAAFREVSTLELSRQFLLRKRERHGEENGAEDEEDPLYPFVCSDCKAGFNAIKALDAHRKEVHKAKRKVVATFTEPRLQYYVNWTITEAREWLNSTVNKLELPATYIQAICAAIEKSATSQGAAQQRAGVKRQRSVTRTPGQILMLMSLNRLTELCGGGAKGAKDAAKLHQEIGLKRAERDRAKKARKADNNEAQRKHQNVRKPWVAYVNRQLKSETEAEEKLAKASVATAASVASAGAGVAPTPAPPAPSIVSPTPTLSHGEAAAPVTASPGAGVGAVPTIVSGAPAAGIPKVAVVNPPGTMALTGDAGTAVSTGAGYVEVAGSMPTGSSNSTNSVQMPHLMTQSPEVVNVMTAATDAFAQIHPSTSAQPMGLTGTMSSVSTGYSGSTQGLSPGTMAPLVATGYMGMASSTTSPTGEMASVTSTVSTGYKDMGQSNTARSEQVAGATSSGGAGYTGMSTSTTSQVPDTIGGMSANGNGYMGVASSAMEVTDVSAPATSVAEVGYVTMASPATQMTYVSRTITSVAETGYVAMTSPTTQMTDVSGTTSSVAGAGYVGMASPATQVTDVSGTGTGTQLTASTGYVGVTPSGSTGPTTYGEVTAPSTTAPQSVKAAGTIQADPNGYMGVASSTTTQPTEMTGGDQTLYVGVDPSSTSGGSEVAGAMSTDATAYVGMTPLSTGQSGGGMGVMPTTGYAQLASATNAQAGQVGQTGSTSSAGFMAATTSTAAPVSAMEGIMSMAPAQYVGVSPSPAPGAVEVTGTLPAAGTGYTGVPASPSSACISGTMSTGTAGYPTVSTGYTGQAIEMGGAMSTAGAGYAELTPASVAQATGVPGTVSSLQRGYVGLTSPTVSQSGEMPGTLFNATTGYVGVTPSGTVETSGMVGSMSTVGTRYASVAPSPGIVGVADGATAGATGYVGVASSPAPVATGGLVSMPGIPSGYMGMVPSTTVQSTAAPGPVIVDLTEPTPIYQS